MSNTTLYTGKRPYYRITNRKKAELDKLALEVLSAQQEVAQYNAMVNSLTDKASNFQGYLTDATTRKATALNNKNLAEVLVKGAFNLKGNSRNDYQKMKDANDQTADLAKAITELIDKLIFCADTINKLSNTVIRRKALNPLISDELVSKVGKACTDANNAVALLLVALKSTFAAQASNTESIYATELEYYYAIKLHNKLTVNDFKTALIMAFQEELAKKDKDHVINLGNDDVIFHILALAIDATPQVLSTHKTYGEELEAEFEKLLTTHAPDIFTQAIKSLLGKAIVIAVIKKDKGDTHSLQHLLEQAYHNTETLYKHALRASNEAKRQLSNAQAKLAAAQINLQSLQAGLAAANAAAFAS